MENIEVEKKYREIWLWYIFVNNKSNKNLKHSYKKNFNYIIYNLSFSFI